eukprot:GHVS01035560.1.p1 GENE.GHVS01035560.1~~GHVS01035560.1.p1  ORF type:complete len:913 (-),score=130.78 GHVS01035560.1:333-3071(-)
MMKRLCAIGCVAFGLFGVEGTGNVGRLELDSCQCPNGSTMEGTFCIRTIAEKPKAVCPSGSLHDGDCIHYSSPMKECPLDYERKGDKCFKFEQMVPTTSCAPGYTLDCNRCVAHKRLEPQCPKGSVVMGGDKCAVYQNAMRKCPDGFTKSGGYHKGDVGAKCVKQIALSPRETCCKGYSMKEGGGGCEFVKVVSPVCPNGSKDEGGMCKIQEEAELRCKDDYIMLRATKECMRMITQIPGVSCQDGYVLNGRVCEKTLKVPAECAGGLEELADGRCASYVNAKEMCAEGFTLSYSSGKAECTKAVRVAAVMVCGEGYEVKDSRCVRTVASPMVCPEGSRFTGSVCEVMYTADAHCHDGFEMTGSQDKKCYRVDRIEAEAVCTNGFVVSDGMCEKRKVCKPVFVCKKGARAGQKCVEHEFVDPHHVCPDGFVKEKKRCVQRVSKDCSTIGYKTECRELPPCYTKECEEKAAARRLFSGRLRQVEAETVCEKVAVKQHKTCDKVLFADLKTLCPEGATAQGKGCIVASYSLPQPECPEGVYEEASGDCVRLLKKALVYSCADGFENAAGNHRQCNKVVVEGVQHYCKEGSLKGSMCFKSVHKVCEGGVCERQEAVQAGMQCPNGYRLSRDRGTCVMHQSVEVVYECSKGELVHSGMCAEYFLKVCPGGKCERMVVSAGKSFCPEGFVMNNRGRFNAHTGEDAECVKKVFEAAEMVCSKYAHSVLVGSYCVKYVEKKCPGGVCEIVSHKPVSYECPNGYREERDFDVHDNRAPLVRHGGPNKKQKYRVQPKQIKCVADEHADFEYVCSRGHVEDNRCVTYLRKSCPNDDCEVTLSARPEHRCEEGFSRRHGGLCEGSFYASPVYKCHTCTGVYEVEGSGSKCKKVTPPVYTCPRGSTRSNGMCVSKRLEEPLVQF